MSRSLYTIYNVIMCWRIYTYIHTHAFSPFVWYFKMHKVFSYMISLGPYNSPVTCNRHHYTHFRDEKMKPREVNELPMISQLVNHRVKPRVQDFCFPGLTFFCELCCPTNLEFYPSKMRWGVHASWWNQQEQRHRGKNFQRLPGFAL